MASDIFKQMPLEKRVFLLVSSDLGQMETDLQVSGTTTRVGRCQLSGNGAWWLHPHSAPSSSCHAVTHQGRRGDGVGRWEQGILKATELTVLTKVQLLLLNKHFSFQVFG